MALKFSQVPLGRAQIFASKGAAVLSVNQGAHEVMAASANEERVDSLIRFPTRYVSSKTLRVQLKLTSTCPYTMRILEWPW